MAIVVSTIFASMRGSIAGTTFFTTPSGAIIARSKTIPSFPATSYQTMINSCFAAASGEWESIDQSERDLWDAYGQTVPDKPDGRTIFMANYSLARYASLRSTAIMTPTSDAPTNPGVLPVEDVGVVEFVPVGTGIAVALTNPGLEAVAVLAQISNGFAPTRNRYKGPWLSSLYVVQALAAESGGIVNFEGLIEDLVYFVRIRTITAATAHRKSSDVFLRAVAETNL